MKSQKFVMPACEIVVIAHNIRSVMYVGSILRTCEGFRIGKVFATGYTPSPDNGLPHVRARIAAALHKTALGAEEIVSFQHAPDILELVETLRAGGFRILGLEQDARAISLPDYKHRSCKIALLLGEEVHGLTPELRRACDNLVEIPMFGWKESFNVAVATGIALYHFTTTQSTP
jgi:tRNA G18 (ribose-2'-O)-methylase SpoU